MRICKKNFVVIPKNLNFQRRDTIRCSTRAFHHLVRNSNLHAKKVCRSHPSRIVSAEYFVLRVDHIREVIWFDSEEDCLMFGSAVIGFTDATIQGSPASPPVCFMACVFLEREHGRMVKQVSTPGYKIDVVMMRWVDDIFTILNIATRSNCPVAKRCIGIKKIRELLAPYVENSGLKDEDSSIFVGLAMSASNNGQIVVEPKFREEMVPKFQHWKSNRHTADKVAVLQGQIVQCIDKFLDTSWKPSFIHQLLAEFKFVGYPQSACDEAVRRVKRKHPYVLF